MMLKILCRQIFSHGRKKNALELELISRAVIQTVSEGELVQIQKKPRAIKIFCDSVRIL